MQVLEHHDRGVDHGADRDDDPAETHDIAVDAKPAGDRERHQNAERQRGDRDERAARVQQEHRADERDNDRLLEQRAQQCLEGPADQVRAVVGRHDPDAGRQRRRDLGNPLLDAVDHAQRVLAIAHDHNSAHRFAFAVPLSDPEPQVRPDRHPGHIADPHRAPVLPDADRDLLDVPDPTEVAEPANRVVGARHLNGPRPDVLVRTTARQVINAVRGANQDVGARTVEVAGSDYAIRGLGYFRGVGDIEKVAVGVGKDGRPMRVGDVARVTIGPDLRLGIAERDGKGEAVGGVVVMRYGENALRVIDGVKQRIAEIAPALPAGVRIVATYDRSDLIHGSIKTLWRTLLEESVIVALVCGAFLLHARSALVAIATLPLGILVSLAVTRWLGINGNIMSLAGIAIAIGAMIDAAIVMLENLHKHIEHEPERPHWERVFAAAREGGPALFMSLLIITLSFLPVFTLEDQEGRLFRPLALTKTFAMAAAALLSGTLVPALMGWFVKGKIRPEAASPLNRWAIQAYRPVLRWALRARWLVLGGAAAILVLTLYPLSRLGSEFMPPLQEGSLMYMPNTRSEEHTSELQSRLHLVCRLLLEK